MSQKIASVMFVCIHNAGRSQMAAAYLSHLAGDRVEVRSSGTMPKDQVNPAVVEVMLEEGIDISGNVPTHNLQRSARSRPPLRSCAPSARATFRVLTARCGPSRHSMARLLYSCASRSEWGVASMMSPNTPA